MIYVTTLLSIYLNINYIYYLLALSLSPAITSISSIKTNEGASYAAYKNNYLIFFSDSPLNDATISAPFFINIFNLYVSYKSLHNALAKYVFPLPVAPVNKIPFGALLPNSVKIWAY